jgi:protein-S-isoprenylcysteine O-methyltransferase Ste14
MNKIVWYYRLFYFPIIDILISTLLYILIKAKRMTSEGSDKTWHIYYWFRFLTFCTLLWFTCFSINFVFWIGLSVMMLGYILFCMGYSAMREHPEKNKPVVDWGIYAFSRNSHIIASKITNLGIIIIGWNPDSTIYSMLWVLFFIDLIITHFALLNEEKNNIEKFGQEFVEYMKKVPRYF